MKGLPHPKPKALTVFNNGRRSLQADNNLIPVGIRTDKPVTGGFDPEAPLSSSRVQTSPILLRHLSTRPFRVELLRKIGISFSEDQRSDSQHSPYAKEHSFSR